MLPRVGERTLDAGVERGEGAAEEVTRMEDEARREAVEKERREREEAEAKRREEEARREAEEKAQKEREAAEATLRREDEARREAEEKARKEREAAEAKRIKEEARREAEEKAQKEREAAVATLRREEEARREAEEKVRKEREAAEAKRIEEEARREAEEKAQKEREAAVATLRREEEARREAEEKARKEREAAEAKRIKEEARREAEEKAQKEREAAEATLRREEEARREAEEKARKEREAAEAKRIKEEARREAEEKAQKEREAAEATLRREEEARREAEEKVRKEREAAEAKRIEEEARREAEEKAQKEREAAEATRRKEEEARREAEEKARKEREAAEATLRREEEARREAEEKARKEREAAEATWRREDEARREAEEKARKERVAAEADGAEEAARHRAVAEGTRPAEDTRMAAVEDEGMEGLRRNRSGFRSEEFWYDIVEGRGTTAAGEAEQGVETRAAARQRIETMRRAVVNQQRVFEFQLKREREEREARHGASNGAGLGRQEADPTTLERDREWDEAEAALRRIMGEASPVMVETADGFVEEGTFNLTPIEVLRRLTLVGRALATASAEQSARIANVSQDLRNMVNNHAEWLEHYYQDTLGTIRAFDNANTVWLDKAATAAEERKRILTRLEVMDERMAGVASTAVRGETALLERSIVENVRVSVNAALVELRGFVGDGLRQAVEDIKKGIERTVEERLREVLRAEAQRLQQPEAARAVSPNHDEVEAARVVNRWLGSDGGGSRVDTQAEVGSDRNRPGWKGLVLKPARCEVSTGTQGSEEPVIVDETKRNAAVARKARKEKVTELRVAVRVKADQEQAAKRQSEAEERARTEREECERRRAEENERRRAEDADRLQQECAAYAARARAAELDALGRRVRGSGEPGQAGVTALSSRQSRENRQAEREAALARVTENRRRLEQEAEAERREMEQRQRQRDAARNALEAERMKLAREVEAETLEDGLRGGLSKMGMTRATDLAVGVAGVRGARSRRRRGRDGGAGTVNPPKRTRGLVDRGDTGYAGCTEVVAPGTDLPEEAACEVEGANVLLGVLVDSNLSNDSIPVTEAEMKGVRLEVYDSLDDVVPDELGKRWGLERPFRASGFDVKMEVYGMNPAPFPLRHLDLQWASNLPTGVWSVLNELHLDKQDRFQQVHRKADELIAEGHRFQTAVCAGIARTTLEYGMGKEPGEHPVSALLFAVGLAATISAMWDASTGVDRTWWLSGATSAALAAHQDRGLASRAADVATLAVEGLRSVGGITHDHTALARSL
ncbi:unnamed protein product [Closterium sp. Yama58-4]|nr:unnamed protein product [Closterium sp. Yama58-4]